MSGASPAVARLRDHAARSRDAVQFWVVLVLVEVAVLAAYLAVFDTGITKPRYAIYPFVWINAGLWVLWRTTPTVREPRQHLVAGGLTAVYLVALLYAGGLVRFLVGDALGTELVVRVGWNLPGWGPTVVLRHPLLQVIVVPFEVVGYVAMAYLVYARLLDATAAVLSGVFGLVSCVGCTFSLLLPLLGATTLFGTQLTTFSWDLSTLVFLVTLGLLYWSDHLGAAVSRWR